MRLEVRLTDPSSGMLYPWQLQIKVLSDLQINRVLSCIMPVRRSLFNTTRTFRCRSSQHPSMNLRRTSSMQ